MVAREVRGEVVRAIREAQGLSLRAVAREIGVSPGHLSGVETGTKRLGTRLGAIYQVRLAEVLGVSLAAITYETGSEPGNTRAPRVPA